MDELFCGFVLSPDTLGLSTACQVYVIPGMLPVKVIPTELLLHMESFVALVTKGIGFIVTGMLRLGPLHPA